MPNPIYEDALDNIIQIQNDRQISILTWIIQQINKSKNGSIKIEASDLRNALGKDFLNKKDSTIYEALRYVMRKHNIKVRQKKSEKGLILIMDYKVPIYKKGH